MTEDHLRSWLGVREAARWHETPAAAPAAAVHLPVRDGAVHDIRTFDRAHGADRADGLLAALARARSDASAGVPLTFDRLASWQRHVLATADAPAFRTTAAFAKAGRERYGIAPDTRVRFDACLSQAADPGLPVAARAARAYLDVCFFHPFADGNGRAAFLALEYVLAAAGVTLDQVGPVRRLQRAADDPADALALANLVASLIRHTHRRAARAAFASTH
ncbi:Fic family protein [Kitasatospora terrestris]|uniref:Fic family protein n=1 Tax=Kitasatospora terrestris TaxID=258051 RepID=UPI0031EEA41C